MNKEIIEIIIKKVLAKRIPIRITRKNNVELEYVEGYISNLFEKKTQITLFNGNIAKVAFEEIIDIDFIDTYCVKINQAIIDRNRNFPAINESYSYIDFLVRKDLNSAQ